MNKIFIILCACFPISAFAQDVVLVGQVEKLDEKNEQYELINEHEVIEFGNSRTAVKYNFKEETYDEFGKNPYSPTFVNFAHQKTDQKITWFGKSNNTKYPLFKGVLDFSTSIPSIQYEKVPGFKNKPVLQPKFCIGNEIMPASNLKRKWTIHELYEPAMIGLTVLGGVVNSPLLYTVGFFQTIYGLTSFRMLSCNPYLYKIEHSEIVDITPSIFRTSKFNEYATMDVTSYGDNVYVLLARPMRVSKQPIAVVKLDNEFNYQSVKYYNSKEKLRLEYLKFGEFVEDKIEILGQAKKARYNLFGQKKILGGRKNSTVRIATGSIKLKDEEGNFSLSMSVESRKQALQNMRGQRKPTFNTDETSTAEIGLFKDGVSNPYSYRSNYNSKFASLLGGRNVSFDTASVFGQLYVANVSEQMVPRKVYVRRETTTTSTDSRGVRTTSTSTSTKQVITGANYSTPIVEIYNNKLGNSRTYLMDNLKFNIYDENPDRQSIRHSDVFFYNDNLYTVFLTSDFKLKVFLVDLTGEFFEIYSEDLSDDTFKENGLLEEAFKGTKLGKIFATEKNTLRNPDEFTYTIGHLGDGKFILKHRMYDRFVFSENAESNLDATPSKNRWVNVRMYQILD